ncbi:helix-turn-helix domain-containing protein [Bacteroides sp. 519]|uniref:helix-turn-helix domain-containing protein n=1 Tax=Bacteroides sp. 519 TaxID=2302937 RepID=UPI0013CFF7CF|nr:helix-turn-helix transcriptional regulator [Bacteroides sp. 519]NDV58925.1 XRE family transcriptional regulator [Bacteroides sp. 519]
MTQIGKNIKKIRNIRSLSQQSFADLFGLTRGNISSYEEFRAEPKIDMVIKIANYFGIPLADFIEKDLSVNQLLHYNTKLVLETEKLKIAEQLVSIPFVPLMYLKEFAIRYKEDDFLLKLPNILVPGASRFRLLALELENPDDLPAGLNYKQGDVLIYEEVNKENVHRITNKLGMLLGNEGMKWGIYEGADNGQIKLSLNSWVEYPFDMDDTEHQYWVMRAVYSIVK